MAARLKMTYRKMFRKRDFAALVAVGIGYALSIAMLLVLLRQFILSLSGEAEWGIETPMILLMLGATALVHAALRMLEFTVPEGIGYHIVRRMRTHLYRHMAAMMPDHIRHRSRGSLILRLTGDLTMLRTWLSRGIGRGIIAALSLASTLTVLAIYSWPIAMAIAAVLLIGSVFSVTAGRRLQKKTAKVRRRRSTLTSNIDEQVHALSTVQLFGRMEGEEARLDRQNIGLTRSLIQEAWWRGMLRGVAAAMGWGALIAALFVGFLLMRHGLTDLGTIVAALIATRLMQGYVTNLSLSHDYWRRAEISRKKLEDFFNSRSRLTLGDGDETLRHNRARITFEDLTIDGAVYGLTSTIAAGSHVALTGPDASAREAVLDAVSKMAMIDGGKVMIGDQDLADCSAQSVWKKVGFISPDLPLMRGTLRRNLTYRGRTRMDDAELRLLIDRIGLGRFVDSQPDGLDLWLTEGGANLPADVRQLVRIIRGIGGNPPILLIDRLSTSLDEVQAARAREFLGNYAATTITASDDPADLRLADEIWTFAEGRLVRTESQAAYDRRVALPTIKRGGGVDWIFRSAPTGNGQ
ncbi:ABC transporter transmembrane domain-containing protein [Sphingomicrobium flavum]|uniref:ABC transporter transmembrane domain-containing protein n=1 Tax=Sphingomicrobium flavum TaxID=1229164 RepID=UPI0021ADE57F|nr:ABC transporter ATP-binding protein [Sphingomicrobium flavum]